MITCAFENGKAANLRHVVVHAIVERDGALLLVKRSPGISEGGKWSLPSGYLDRDETAAQGALRELKEETGWDGEVRSLFIIKTDPHRPHEDRQNVSFHFLITPTKQTGVKDGESTAVAWVPIRELPPLYGLAFDHGEAVEWYLRYRSQEFSLPLVM
ncbi:NUDIX hydrolase [Patescibacteria group bacterium]|nr:NUDIX hydrolase [Patescibacteria group bacterium]